MKDVITALTITTDVTLITIERATADIGLLAKLFTDIGETLNIDMISMTPPYKNTISISFTVSDSDLKEAITYLNQLKQSYKEDFVIDINSTNSKISLYGEGMREMKGVFAKTLETLNREEVEIKLITTSEVDISYLIYSSDESRAVDAILNSFDNVKIHVQ